MSFFCIFYDQAIGNNDSDDGSSLHNRALSLATVNAKLDSRLLAAAGSVNEQLDEQRKVCENAIGASSDVHGDESQRSMGDILSCVDQELHQSTPGHDMLPDKPMPKHSSLSAKKSMFWGRKNVSFSFYCVKEPETKTARGGWRLISFVNSAKQCSEKLTLGAVMD